MSCRIPVGVGSEEAVGRVYPCRSLCRQCDHPASGLHLSWETRFPLTPSHPLLPDPNMESFHLIFFFAEIPGTQPACLYIRLHMFPVKWAFIRIATTTLRTLRWVCVKVRIVFDLFFFYATLQYNSIFSLLKIHIILSKYIYIFKNNSHKLN